MKKVIILWFMFLAVLLFMTSCGSKKPIVVEKTKTVTETIRERDTVIQVEVDSSAYKALIECQNGKPVIKEVIESKSGTNLKKPKVELNANGELAVDCETELRELRFKLRDKEKTSIETIEIPIEVPAEISGWQWFQIWAGRLFLLLLIGLGIGWLIKKSNMKKTYSESELKEKAAKVFEQYPLAAKAYATSDGNVFLHKNRANLHAGKGKVHTFDRPEETPVEETGKEQTIDFKKANRKQLVAFAEEKSIDLGGLTAESLKADIVEVIQKALEPVQETPEGSELGAEDGTDLGNTGTEDTGTGEVQEETDNK